MAQSVEDDRFATICSTITVQSEEQGFFTEFYESARDMCGDEWILNDFKKLESDRAKILSLYNDPGVCDIVLGTLEHVKPVYKEKNAKISIQRRAQGDAYMAGGDPNAALLVYSHAVMRAPSYDKTSIYENGLTLALAFWSRSKALLDLNEGAKAVVDLQQAVKNNFQVKHHPDYYWRLGKAYAQAGEIQKARVSFSLAEKLLLGFEDSLTLLKEDKVIAEEVAADVLNSKKSTNLPPSLSGEYNTDLPSASSLLALHKSDYDSDRYIIAANQIQAGDTLLVEDPISACIYPKHYGSHCYDCFTRLSTPYNCFDCAGVAFCSPECRDKACRTYHKFECKYLDLLIGSGMAILCRIALKMVLQTDNNVDRLNELKTTLNNLCSHSKLRKPHDYFQRTLMTTFLLRFLQHSGFFGRRMTESVEPNEKELNVGEILLGLLQALQFNAHEIFETKLGEKKRVSGSKTLNIGVGIYKTGSLFNHECLPSVTRTFVGTKLIFHAAHPHNRGEIVSENYGPIFTRKTLQERQRSLRARYWFTCQCRACANNWPTLDTLKETIRFKCQTNNCSNILVPAKKSDAVVKCTKCREKIDLKTSVGVIQRAVDLYHKGAECIDNDDTSGAITLLCQGINLFYDVAVPPHKDTQIAEDSLRMCYADKGTTF